MKKWICLSLCLVLSMALLVSCGDKNQGDDNGDGKTPPSQSGSLPTGQDPIMDDLDWELD